MLVKANEVSVRGSGFLLLDLTAYASLQQDRLVLRLPPACLYTSDTTTSNNRMNKTLSLCQLTNERSVFVEKSAYLK